MTDLLIRRLLGHSLEDLVPWQPLTKQQGRTRFARAWREFDKHAVEHIVARAVNGDPQAMRWVEERLTKIEAGESRGWQRPAIESLHDDDDSEDPSQGGDPERS